MKTDAFSKLEDKMQKFNDAENKLRVESPSKDSSVQKKIDEREKAFIESVKRKFDSYVMPLSREVEYAEKQLVTAFKLYLGLKDLNEKTGNDKEFISFDLVSPFLQSPQFNGDDFVYLQIWFVRASGAGSSSYVPVREEKTPGSSLYKLSFVAKNSFKADINMKEILNALDS